MCAIGAPLSTRKANTVILSNEKGSCTLDCPNIVNKMAKMAHFPSLVTARMERLLQSRENLLEELGSE